MFKITPCIELESGRIVRRGDLIRIETIDRGPIVGRFVNALMDCFDSEKFNVRLINEKGHDMEVVANRYITSIAAY